MSAAKILTLPSEVISLIAAGEVIDSTSAIIRELVENSLDADATRISIYLDCLNWQFRVVDNGRGMSAEDLLECARAHSTSKIHQAQDIWQIKTLGFRGEALQSLAQIAELEISSRLRDGTGLKVKYDHQGELAAQEVVAMAPGTQITVKNIFARYPLRQKALLSNIKQQLKAINNITCNLALTHPHVTWQFWQDQKIWFNLSCANHSSGIITQIIKSIKPGDLQQFSQNIVTPDNLTGNIDLTIGLPDRCHRSKADWIKVAINGRIVDIPALQEVIMDFFSRTLPKDRFPLCFVHCQIPFGEIDWNRHPAKGQIYLNGIEFWQNCLHDSLKKALCLTQKDLIDPVPVRQMIKLAENSGNYQLDSPSSQTTIKLKAVAQVHNTYIVAEHADGIWLVEQHVAHERVLYEQIKENWQLQELDQPIILKDLTLGQVKQLQNIGLMIEQFGQALWAVRTIPQILKQDLHKSLLELSLGGDLDAAQVAVACRSAIRNGTALSLEQMQTLLQQWMLTQNPRTCPHGRPTYLPLEGSSLSRFFQRNWLIKKK